MSIKISARRYISEMGLNGLNWNLPSKKPVFDANKITDNLVVVQKQISEFYLFSGFYNGFSWIGWNQEAGYYEINNIVCWSEIKI